MEKNNESGKLLSQWLQRGGLGRDVTVTKGHVPQTNWNFVEGR